MWFHHVKQSPDDQGRTIAVNYYVGKGNNCGVQFELINEGYDIVMSNLRGMDESSPLKMYEKYDQQIGKPMRWMNYLYWDMWEEWIVWEGVGIRDYTSHINPYI